MTTIIGEVLRTIPTGVGKILRAKQSGLRDADHPHGRGENEFVPLDRNAVAGPSPRAWGKFSGLSDLFFQFRTIPTGVGKIFLFWRRGLIRADHPHGRGENTLRRLAGAQQGGPSPRAWGKCAKAPGAAPGNRTIPTGVGKMSHHQIGVDLSADHPHGRGENIKRLRKRITRGGPSPRAWGKSHR